MGATHAKIINMLTKVRFNIDLQVIENEISKVAKEIMIKSVIQFQLVPTTT